jgi:hypothetical protein
MTPPAWDRAAVIGGDSVRIPHRGDDHDHVDEGEQLLWHMCGVPRPMIAAPESQTAATRSGYLGSAAATMTVKFTAGLLAASSPDTT